MSLSALLQADSEKLESARKVWIGYSGGLDSTVLLHACVELLGTSKVGALHLNHQLQEQADEWCEHCENQARALGIEFRSARLNITNKGEGLESEARQLRYQFFRESLGENELLLLAHHADDQAETLLYRLFRGSGVRGLSAIPEERLEGCGTLLRPLLSLTKQSLEDAANSAGLVWIEDPSNTKSSYDRNYIRNQILPVIQERWPVAAKTMARASENLYSATQLLDEYAEQLLIQCEWRQESVGYSFTINSYESISEQAQALVLESALRQQNLSGFDASLPLKVRLLIETTEDKEPLLRASNTDIRRYSGRIFVMPKLPDSVDKSYSCMWDGLSTLQIVNCGKLLPLPSVSMESYSGNKMRISFRQGGERCKPLNRDKSQTLKKLFQEYGLEPWLRDRTPLLWQGDQLIAAAGLFSCAENLPAPQFQWQLQ